MTKRPSRSGKAKKPTPSTKGASGEPPKAESAILGAEAKTKAEPFASPPAPRQVQPLEPIGIETLGATISPTISPMSLRQTDVLTLTPISTGTAPTAGTAPAPGTSDLKVGSVAIVEGRLSREPAAIRDLARNLSQEFARQAEDLKRSRPNDERLAQHDDLIAFFERMACGLAELADALDEAVSKGTGGSLDSGSLGKAAQIARELHQGVMQWIEQNVTSSIDRVFNVGLFCAGIAFLHWIGADSTKVVAGLTTLLAIKGGQAKDAPNSKKKPRKSKPSY